MLIGYVSNEYYLAISDAQVELRRPGWAVVLRSGPSGAVYADIEPGEYEAILAKSGYGSKRVRSVRLGSGEPHHFRLLSDLTLGYAWPPWCRSGSRVEFRVHSVEPFKVGLWRYGYEKSFIRNVGWYDDHGPRAMMQTVPDGHFVESGVKWFAGNMAVHQQAIEAPETTGLYYFHVKGESGSFFSFPFVVAPREPGARIAVLASTNTWNAYNPFGGRSNYFQASRMASQPIVNSRQDLGRYSLPDYGEWKLGSYEPLSFDRPNPANFVPENETVTDLIEGRMACAMAPAEWRTLGWLENEGFEYDLYSDYQLHSGEMPLEEYKVLLLNVHPEYWSVNMYDRVKHWVHQGGGRLVYLGGNGINGPVEFLDDATMRCINDWPEGTESRFHCRKESEANLLGVVFSDAGAMTVAAYRTVKPDHWVFQGTGLKAGDTFGHKTQHERYGDGASGHETDKMTPSSPAGTVLLAKGLNPDNGGAEMTYYELSNGGAVFSVGSITFPTALFLDQPCSRITSNVLKKFLG
jgi:N,N-dimethylformamidase beta subunit-like, C-terminal